METAQITLDELSRKSSNISSKLALIGLDGFVDKIIKPVANRYGQGPNFEPIPTIEAFGKRILSAAGKSANIELYLELEKLGGNGPILANGLQATGMKVDYIGALGNPNLHPVFEDFAKRVQVHSLAEPGITDALEFEDGKLMLGKMASLDEVTFDQMLSVIGEGKVIDLINRADLIGIVNWTMIPNMTSLLENLLTRILPNLGPKESGRTFFFDLADPAKRSNADIAEVLQVISRYRSHGAVTLGLNYSEGCQCGSVLGLGEYQNNPEDLKALASRIRSELNLTCVVIHPREGAAASTREGESYVHGPFCKHPKISTGAGDHFNAGFSAAQCLGLSIPACLTVAVATSGQYVRTAQSPSLRDTSRFIESWTKGQLSD